MRSFCRGGGRPDLANEELSFVRVPTLLVIGGEDHVVINSDHKAAISLNCEHRIEIVPAAAHLFEEPGALDQVVDLAVD